MQETKMIYILVKFQNGELVGVTPCELPSLAHKEFLKFTSIPYQKYIDGLEYLPSKFTGTKICAEEIISN